MIILNGPLSLGAMMISTPKTMWMHFEFTKSEARATGVSGALVML